MKSTNEQPLESPIRKFHSFAGQTRSCPSHHCRSLRVASFWGIQKARSEYLRSAVNQSAKTLPPLHPQRSWGYFRRMIDGRPGVFRTCFLCLSAATLISFLIPKFPS